MIEECTEVDKCWMQDIIDLFSYFFIRSVRYFWQLLKHCEQALSIKSMILPGLFPHGPNNLDGVTNCKQPYSTMWQVLLRALMPAVIPTSSLSHPSNFMWLVPLSLSALWGCPIPKSTSRGTSKWRERQNSQLLRCFAFRFQEVKIHHPGEHSSQPCSLTAQIQKVL